MTLDGAIKVFLTRGWITIEGGTYFDGNKWREAIMVISDYFQNEYKALEHTRWIPVSERLPEQYKEVIVTDIEISDTYISRYIGNGYWECDNGLFKNRIIAWQPKPQPYKSESEDKE